MIRLSNEIGAELPGMDLSGPVSETMRSDILTALYEHQLLLFRGQRLTPGHHVAFSRYFGQLLPNGPEHRHPDYPEIRVISNVDAQISDANYWHTDGLALDEPASVSLLYPRQLPEEGGDTLFVNACIVYESLPAELKQRIEGCRMIYGDGITHPMVRTHPVTRRRALYGDLRIYKGKIEGMTSREKEGLIRELLAHVEHPDRVYAHQWHPGDLLMWDNASVLHRGAVVGPGPLRVLDLIAVCGAVPF